MTTHDITVLPDRKMDTPVGLFRAHCSCGWVGGFDSKRGATEAGAQHAHAGDGVLDDYPCPECGFDGQHTDLWNDPREDGYYDLMANCAKCGAEFCWYSMDSPE